MDEEVLSPRETEIEVRFRSLETRTLETVERNGELLQKLSDLNDELSVSESTVSELESGVEQVGKETLRIAGLMEQSLLMSQKLQSSLGTNDVKSLEREVWRLERESRRFCSSPSRTKTRPRTSLPAQPPANDLRHEILSTREELAELKRKVLHISQTSVSSENQSTAEHHHYHYYYHIPEVTELPMSSAKDQTTPVHSRFFRELPTPPTTASSISSISRRHERIRSSLSSCPPIDIVSDSVQATPDMLKSGSRESLLSLAAASTDTRLTTPTIKRAVSHESIFESASKTRFHFSSPISSTTTPSPTYLSASAHLRQNQTSSLLLLSAVRGKQSRSLSSRRSFWNLWDKSRTGTKGSPLRSVSNPSGLGRPVVVCTEVDVGMLRDALDESL